MIEERLKQLRVWMAKAKLDFYLVPSTDAHRNEYVPDCWQRRAWISGFTGSAGDVLIGKEQAYLWTDGRYFLQAEQQLDSTYFQLMKQEPGALPMHVWLNTQGDSVRIGVDPSLLTIQQQTTWLNTLNSHNSKLIAIEENGIDVLWQDQPSLPAKSIFSLEDRYTGHKVDDKLTDLRTALEKHDAGAMVITRLDAIAWLLNIRGNDIAYNPLVIAYAIVTQNNASLFIDPNKITEPLKHYCEQHNITLATYSEFDVALKKLKDTVLLDPQSTSWRIAEQLKETTLVFAPSPITLMKAVKNNTEQNGMREAHRIDAVAMIKFLHWMEQHWQDGITEISAAKQLEGFRREDARCKGLSFPSISGFGSHGTIIHYLPNDDTNTTIDDSALYLVDSGAQYFSGTTDITRTMHLGEPTADEKKHYTLVLKGHLALQRSIFPTGTFGEQLDSLARLPLWSAGLNYAHGTGHGVGSYLCVHEGPQCISPRTTRVPLEAGMVVSNEPGFYRENHYGIRIENLCLVTPGTENGFLRFEDLTLVPYAHKLIDTRLLTTKEIEQINEYHKRVRECLLPELPEIVSKWLEKATKPLRIIR